MSKMPEYEFFGHLNRLGVDHAVIDSMTSLAKTLDDQHDMMRAIESGSSQQLKNGLEDQKEFFESKIEDLTHELCTYQDDLESSEKTVTKLQAENKKLLTALSAFLTEDQLKEVLGD